MLSKIVAAMCISFAVGAVSGPIVIPLLRRFKFGQTVRKEGPETHLKKSGTPTMGGVMFILGILIACLPFVKEYTDVIPVLFLTIMFGIIGFLDDFIKVKKKRSTGLYAWQKFLLQIVATAIFAYFLTDTEGIDLLIRIPFTDKMIDPGILGIPLLFFVVLGTDTGSNFTDGLDGLASSVTAVIALFFVAASLMTGEGSGGAIVAAAVFGGLLAFLLFNAFPAKVFMGDTGALALGGFVAGMAYMMHMPLFLPFVAIIYVVEVLSVIMQVSYFKLTHGKRIFKMAPIHHHFEKCGWSETRIVTVFSVITILMCMICLAGVK